jgi:hypothetical protein
MNRAYRVALFCGVFPLLVGISIFLLWVITSWEWLMTAGYFALCGGVPFFIVGVVALADFCWLANRNPDSSSRRIWLSMLGCGGLLVSNFVAAGGILAAVLALESRYSVVINNASRQSLDDVYVFGGGCEISFGSIPPGRIVRRSFWIQGDGELQFHAIHGSTVIARTVDEYVTSNSGSKTAIHIKPDGSISVTRVLRYNFAD